MSISSINYGASLLGQSVRNINNQLSDLSTSLATGQEGWLDGANFQTFTIPAPGAAGLLGLAGLGAMRRRRR